MNNFHRAWVRLFWLEAEGLGGLGASNLVVRVVEGSEFLTEEGVGREVLHLLLDKIGLLFAHFHTLCLVVEELEEHATESFYFVNGALGIYFHLLRQVQILSLLCSAVKSNSAPVVDYIRV